DDRAKRPDVFDPALKHFPRGFRKGDPEFKDAEQAECWRAARRRAMFHVLQLVNDSSLKEDLVLRGSVVLKAWLGEAAREPNDLDWVVTSKSMGPQITEALIQLVTASPRAGELEFVPERIAADAIWIYDRAPGRRVLLPWRVEGLPEGAVQCDF